MPTKKRTLKEIVVEYIEKFPDTPNRALARIIYYDNDNNKIFKSLEAVRSSIRYTKGCAGKRSRQSSDDSALIGQFSAHDMLRDIPKGYRESPNVLVPYRVRGKRALVIADIHVEFHDRRALASALQYGVDNKVDCVIILGDLNDFYKISSFSVDPRQRHLYQELVTAHKVLKLIRKQFPHAEIILKLGNHEDRLNRWYTTKSPELLHIPQFQYEQILGLAQLDIVSVASLRLIKMGNLSLLHGHEFKGGSSPISPARAVFLKGYNNCLVGHWHVTSTFSKRSVGGNRIQCYSIGCLSDLQRTFNIFNNWNHGLALVEVTDNTGSFLVKNLEILNGVVLD